MKNTYRFRITLLACCLLFSTGAFANFVMQSFTARPDGPVIALEWVTTTEANTDYFVVEKTADGVVYTEVTRITGSGTSHMPQRYTAEDQQPSAGTSYYRIRQRDVNGVDTYSDYVAVTFAGDDDPSLVAYPNPCSGAQVSIRVEAKEGEEITVSVRGLMGREYCRQIVRADFTGENVFTIHPAAQLEAGTYMVVIMSAETVMATNFMVK